MMRRRLTTGRLLLLATFAAAAAGCSFHAGVGGGTYTPGATQAEVTAGLSPQQRVLYRDRDLMIVEQPPGRDGTATLRFENGRLQTWSADPPP